VSAETIARALGRPVYRSGGWWRCPCPLHQGKSPSLALRDGERGRLVVFCHAGCDWREVRAEIARLRLIDESPTSAEPEAQHDDGRRIAYAMALWRETRPATGPIATYFAARGITLPMPKTLRLHSAIWPPPLTEGRAAMVAIVTHAERGRVGIHCTYLAPDATKSTIEPVRRCFGPVSGAAVRLAAVDAARSLIVAEGIETTLSVMQETGLPGWAALSAGGLEQLVLPPVAEVPRVLICADHDRNGRGEVAARTAAALWLSEGRRVRIAMPPTPGTDFNDLLLGEIHAA
jgi:putative DNA primase/helicase